MSWCHRKAKGGNQRSSGSDRFEELHLRRVMVETPGPHQRTTTSLKPPSGATVGSTPEKTLYPEVEQAHTKSTLMQGANPQCTSSYSQTSEPSARAPQDPALARPDNVPPPTAVPSPTCPSPSRPSCATRRAASCAWSAATLRCSTAACNECECECECECLYGECLYVRM